MTQIQCGNLTIRQAKVADAKQLAVWWNDGAVIAHAGFSLSEPWCWKKSFEYADGLAVQKRLF